MGGTDPNNFLNAVGKRKVKGGKKGATTTTTTTTGQGDIMIWKRKAEEYLVNVCGKQHNMDYVILHPGGLVDETSASSSTTT
jgi:hypothetical protein